MCLPSSLPKRGIYLSLKNREEVGFNIADATFDIRADEKPDQVSSAYIL
jgi:hypothetical protein